MKLYHIPTLMASIIAVCQALPAAAPQDELFTKLENFEVEKLSCEIVRSKRNIDYTSQGLEAFEFPEEELKSLDEYHVYDVGEGKGFSSRPDQNSEVDAEKNSKVDSTERTIPGEASEASVKISMETPQAGKPTSQTNTPSMVTRIQDYIFDNLPWLDTLALQEKMETARNYANKIYEYFQGPPIDEATQKSLDLDAAEDALENLRLVVRTVFRGNTSPKVRAMMKTAGDTIIEKVRPLTFLSCPQTTREKKFRVRLDRIHELAKEAIKRLNKSYYEGYWA